MPLDEAWIALSLVPRIGNKTIDTLLETFGDAQAVLSASKKDLMQIRGIGTKTTDAIQTIDFELFQEQLAQWQNADVQIITRDDATYPTILRDIPDPPLTLFVRGCYQPENWLPAVAIVGTRNPTAMSRAFAGQLATGYAQKGWTIVSGLALGIDAWAHQGALQTPTPTIAVLGGGVLNIYPPQHQDLADRILNTGCLISENAPDATAIASRLVTRNRIISGLCQRVIVVQSDIKGGAMHAARATQQQGRDLYTVDYAFSGNQALLEQGAHPINPHQLEIPAP